MISWRRARDFFEAAGVVDATERALVLARTPLSVYLLDDNATAALMRNVHPVRQVLDAAGGSGTFRAALACGPALVVALADDAKSAAIQRNTGRVRDALGGPGMFRLFFQ